MICICIIDDFYQNIGQFKLGLKGKSCVASAFAMLSRLNGNIEKLASGLVKPFMTQPVVTSSTYKSGAFLNSCKQFLNSYSFERCKTHIIAIEQTF